MKPIPIRRALTFRERLRKWYDAVRWWLSGKALERKLAKPSEVRDYAQEAVNRVVAQTDIAPDCINAQVVRGGPTIMVKHDDAWEAFVHKTYALAADKAIEWLNLQGDEIDTRETSNMNRKERRAFDRHRRKQRGGRKRGQRLH